MARDQAHCAIACGFIVIPLIGAFFIDLLNAGVIQFFISLLSR